MSKHETPLTEHFWRHSCPGAFIPEYLMVRRTGEQGPRLADAIILPDEPNKKATRSEYPSLSGQNVVVVQTKAKRLGMYLMGQGVFSAHLVRKLGAATVRSVIIATKSDAALLPLLADFQDIEVWIVEPSLVHVPERIWPPI